MYFYGTSVESGSFFPQLQEVDSLEIKYLFQNYLTCLIYKSHDFENLMLTVHME